MEKTIIVAPKAVLLTRDYMDDLGKWLRREPGSREAFILNATEVLYAFYEWGGKIVTPESGNIDIVPGLFDDIHGEGSSGEWISEQRRREQAARAPRKTLLGRLRVYDGVARLTGRPIGQAARHEEVTVTRRLLAQLTPSVLRSTAVKCASCARMDSCAIFVSGLLFDVFVSIALNVVSVKGGPTTPDARCAQIADV